MFKSNSINSDRISYLVRQYLDKKITELELYELTGLLLDEDASEEFRVALDQMIMATPGQDDYNEEQWESLYQKILEHRSAPVVPLPQKTTIRRMHWKNWAAAVVLLLAIGLGSYLAFFKKQTRDLTGTQASASNKKDIAPGGDKAVLTLANGRQIVLDKTSGDVAREGGATVINLEGQLSYEKGTAMEATPVAYHTVSTPRGGQYQLVLQDSTRVWLNAASSLRFPTVFAGNDRVVELTGEGYFEVAHNRKKPFKVVANGMEVQVVGTHFNINSYSDEDAIRTTLLEGAVKVKAGNGEPEAKDLFLKPGEQAVVKDQRIQLNSEVDVEAIIAWKNGYFYFQGIDLKSITRQLGRWYDVEVVYESELPTRTFTGKIGRHMSLFTVLKILEQSNVHFRMEGKKLIITK